MSDTQPTEGWMAADDGGVHYYLLANPPVTCGRLLPLCNNGEASSRQLLADTSSLSLCHRCERALEARAVLQRLGWPTGYDKQPRP